ncbi:transcriptional repressor [Desulfurispirillum indicum]|uniref:Ferric-uptake regulator n=1 Tax=Desulfurispirillum indicum (strain ATCC BAA-1389 / DSM 22839 / S5) TaxID=653733 RepID=E6W0F8_DESIS|nr:Fur family transcriptional regulator [Desulfurispirillum indicum]ADU66376.1 ferric-uptake regulator [Desulfurispirillum indicum S5]UCZ55709.1 transcriptional repressor [Desulfurispirillum indicum]
MQIERALESLRKQGIKTTGKRRALLEVLGADYRFLSAKELYEALAPEYPSISFDTIYRNMGMFVKAGILETTNLEGERRFRLGRSCGQAHDDHQHYVICLGCGSSLVLPGNCPVKAMALPGNFQITGHKLEIYGYCEQCCPADGS